jgi:MFS family permease
MSSAGTAIKKNSVRDLRLVMAGQGISLVGDAITGLALPIVAVDLLHADSLGTGLLGAASTVAYLALGLQAGVWIDRASRRQFLIAADVARVVLLLAIPILYALGVLTLPLLIATQVGIGAATAFFQIAMPAYLPRLASGERLLKINSRIVVLGEGAGFIGPGLAGGLITLFSAPVALIADALSFAASALSIAAIKTKEPAAPKKPSHSVAKDLREGVRALWARPLLRLITLEAVNGNVAFSIMMGQSIIFQRLDLGFSPALIGATASAGFLGGLLGSSIAPAALKRIGFGRLIFGTTIIFGFIEFLQPLAAVAPVELRIPLVVANFFLGGFFLMTYVVPVTTFRQLVIPDRLLGRVMGVNRVLTWGAGATFGFAIGGVIANATNRPAALLIGAIMQTLVPLAMFGGARIWKHRTIEDAVRSDTRAASR